MKKNKKAENKKKVYTVVIKETKFMTYDVGAVDKKEARQMILDNFYNTTFFKHELTLKPKL